jgi:hypothetical protein
LPGKALDLAVGERHELVALEKVEDALPEEVHDDADVAPEVETIPEMNASIPVLLIVCLQGCKHTEFDTGSITIFLYRANDLDGNRRASAAVLGHDDFAKSPLSEKFHHLIWE